MSRTGEAARAESYLRQALEKHTHALARDHWMISEAQGALGECLIEQRRYDEAEPLLVEANAADRALFGQQDPRTTLARRRLDTLYEAWGKPQEAARLGPTPSE